MPLSAGNRLGPYEIISPLGAGGMGEVYRALDTRLDRHVAIKVLPSHLSDSVDLKQRFEREAKAISALQHPNICTLFDVGSENGTGFLVMEYLEGETLADRLKRGPIPLAQLLKMALELSHALEKAHSAGLIHRDIKPGNIMLTKGGAKLLDFGLAKPSAIGAAAVSSGSGSAPLLSGALTQSSPAAALTSVGTVVGTVQYMSPEQIAGQEADVRSDIFCFGAVLYEAAAGERAFKGKTPSAVVGAILANDPPPASSLQPSVPAAFDRVVATCLAKDPVDRFESAHDLRLQLEWVRDFGVSQALAPNAAAATLPRRFMAAAFVLGLLTLLAALWFWTSRPSQSTKVIAAEISAPPGETFISIGDLAGAPAISPQGDQIAFVVAGADKVHSLWVRRINSLVAQKLEGTEGAAHPFWSPDGKFIGFFTPTKLNRVPAAGGSIVAIADVLNPRGGSWGKQGVIVYAADFRTGLMQVNAQGGTPSPATVLDPKKHTTHRWPYFLPDGKHFLYFATHHSGGRSEDYGVYFASLDGKENRQILVSDSAAEYGSGYLLFRVQTALVAQPFDPVNGKLSGTAVPVINSVRYDGGVWRNVFSVSQDGLLCYQPGTASAAGTQLAWYDRSGKLLQTVGERGSQTDIRLSPDGKKLALLEGDPFWELWVLDLERGGRTRVTYNEGTPAQPNWSPDGKMLVYTTSTGTGQLFDVRIKPANGNGPEQTARTGHTYFSPNWSPDGKYLVYLQADGPGGESLWAMPQSGDGKPFIVVQPPTPQYNIVHYRISPDGRWVAYSSDETGRIEIYIAPFPKGDGKWQVSSVGASYPVWRGDSKELFIKGFSDNIFSISFQDKNGEPQIGQPKELFKANMYGNGFPYDVKSDGQKFLVNKSEESGAAPLYLLVNWTDELKQK